MKRTLVLLACAALGACGRSDDAGDSSASTPAAGWVGSWAAAPYGPYPIGPISSVRPSTRWA